MKFGAPICRDTILHLEHSNMLPAQLVCHVCLLGNPRKSAVDRLTGTSNFWTVYFSRLELRYKAGMDSSSNKSLTFLFPVLNHSTNLSSQLPAYVRFSGWLYIWSGVTLSINVASALLTALLLLVITQKLRPTSGSKVLIAHLVFIELAMTSILLPINTLVTVLAPFYKVQQRDCIFIHFTFLVVSGAGYWNTALLAFNRLIAFAFPAQYSWWTRKSVMVGSIFTSWTISIAVYLPYCFGVGGKWDALPPWYSCGLRPTSPAQYSWTLFLAIYIPLILVGICYFIVLLKFLARNRVGRNVEFPAREASTQEYHQRSRVSALHRRRRTTTFALFLSSLWYVLCYFPTSIITSLHVELFLENPVMQLWLRTVFLLGYAGSPVCWIFWSALGLYRYKSSYAAMRETLFVISRKNPGNIQ